MVKEIVEEITKYKCEICNEVYENKNNAIDCELKKIEPLHPIGMMFTMVGDDEIVIAIIKQYPHIFGHNHSYDTWVCGDTDIRDIKKNDFCIIHSWTKIYPPNKTIPAYKRMITALKEAKITPSDYGNTI